MAFKKKLDGSFEQILNLIIGGDTFRQIAKKYNCSLDTLHKYLNLDEHSVRTREALELSAASYADKAEEVLIKAKSDKNEIARAKELSQLYRWKAAKRAPKIFGEKLDVTSNGKALPTAINIILDNGNSRD